MQHRISLRFAFVLALAVVAAIAPADDTTPPAEPAATPLPTPLLPTPPPALPELATDPARQNLPALAVVDFDVVGEGIDPSAGRALAENLLPLFGAERFRLVERGALNRLLTEQNLQSSDIVGDAQRAARFGKVMGVRYLITGSINRFGNLNISARLIDAQTATVLAAELVQGHDVAELRQQLPELAKRLQMTPAERALDDTGSPASSTAGATIDVAPGKAGGAVGRDPRMAGRATIDLGRGLRMELIAVRSGKFAMGSPRKESGRDDDEGPQTTVTLSRGYWIAQTEVTVEQFGVFVDETGYKTAAERGEGVSARVAARSAATGGTWRDPGFRQEPNHPVVFVTWDDATEFCRWLTTKSGRAITLPSEAQWEYACRAGTITRYHWGDEEWTGRNFVNGADRSASGRIRVSALLPFDDGFVYTAPAQGLSPNRWGLHNMSGNVWEYCLDWFGDRYPGGAATDWAGPDEGQFRVIRGGSWDYEPKWLRSAARGRAAQDGYAGNIGFRIVSPMADSEDAGTLVAEVEPDRERSKYYGRLGVRLMELTPEEAADRGHAGIAGLLVEKVDQDSHAQRAGLRDGMLLRRADGRDLAALRDFDDALGSARGNSMTLVARLTRGDQKIILNVR